MIARPTISALARRARALAPLGAIALGLIAVAWATAAQTGGNPDLRAFTREPPEKIVTAEACGECHISELEVWKRTPHATGFKTLHRTEAAEAIAAKMGFRLMKRDSLCIECHYTPEFRGEQLRAVSGVSCESCHGAGRDWIDLHNDYGKGFDHTTETPQHREQRIAASRAAGMRRPTDLYGVAASCMGCHTVPDERLVNVGGHTTGSPGFELVEWSQGEIRHNFLQSFLTGDGTENRQHDDPEKRPMYVLGRLVDLEFTLRAAAEATEPGTYSRAVGRRAKTATVELRKIAQQAEIAEIADALEIVRGVRVVPDNRDALLAAADALATVAKRFAAADQVAAQSASLDPLVQGLPIALPEPEPAAVAATAATAAAPDGTAEAGDAAGATPATRVVRAGRPAVGDVKRRIRPASRHQTLGPGACSGCHQEANDWWARDAHFSSAEPFFSRSPQAVRIATLYGVPREQMVTGRHLCMNCHGTVVSGSEAFEVFDGASCESCHGAAADYLEIHREGDKAQGVNRPGYRKALAAGMVELKKLPVRAQTCTSCHYITDRRLISSGHPSGQDFDYVAGMAKVKHWPTADPGAGTLRSAFGTVVAARGAVPDVPLGELPETAEVAVAAASAGATPGRSWNRARPASRTVRGGRTPVASLRRPGAAPVELPPFPEIDAATPIEESLLLLKERLEQVYEAVRGER
ncbi:MAG: multiheme c-type cytochrome [Acidobacteriota bacterium]